MKHVVCVALALLGCARSSVVTLSEPQPSLVVQKPALYPETLEYDRTRDVFLVGSMREGAVYAVDRQGAVSLLVDDARLSSVLGIVVDAERRRLWLVTSDLGASIKPSPGGPKSLAAVAVYDLWTGAPLHYVDLAPLSPGPHLLNGIALDATGNAYVTDSFSPVIYKIDVEGDASVVLRDARFDGLAINLNGVVVHPDGYLLVVKKSDGSLFKVPLAKPHEITQVSLTDKLVGGDGLVLLGKGDLVVVANQTSAAASNAVFALSSDDDWQTAKLEATQPLGDVYPTTGVLRDGKLYVVHSKLNALLKAPPEQRAQLQEQAVIEQVGRVAL